VYVLLSYGSRLFARTFTNNKDNTKTNGQPGAVQRRVSDEHKAAIAKVRSTKGPS
jgi:hypothetical protein